MRPALKDNIARSAPSRQQPIVIQFTEAALMLGECALI